MCLPKLCCLSVYLGFTKKILLGHKGVLPGTVLVPNFRMLGLKKRQKWREVLSDRNDQYS